MKKLLKKDRIAFVKDAYSMFTHIGFQPIPEDLPDAREGSLRIMTDHGIYLVHEPDADFGYCSINGRFTDTSDFKPQGGQTPIDVNPYSGKWNILHSDPQTSLDEFARRMKRVNARAIRPGEMDEQDARDAAKLAADRAEWKAWDEARSATP